jgi:hypothetical protein
VADSANWSVRASNPGGYAESHGKLTVRRVEKAPPLPEPEPPVFIEPLTNFVEVVAGSSVTLSGRLHPGYPPPQIYWKHDDKLVHHHYHWDSMTQRSSSSNVFTIPDKSNDFFSQNFLCFVFLQGAIQKLRGQDEGWGEGVKKCLFLSTLRV